MGENNQDASVAAQEGRYAHLSPSQWLWLAINSPALYSRLSYISHIQNNADPENVRSTRADRRGASRCPLATGALITPPVASANPTEAEINRNLLSLLVWVGS